MRGWILSGILAAGCATTQPPERLVMVDAELSRPEVTELAQAQPAAVRKARENRDASWAAVDDGDDERADLHAWIAWQQLRIAENLEAIAQGQALGEATPVAAATPDASVTYTEAGASEPAARGGTTTGAAAAVRDAEDARLRLLAVGVPADQRWAEAEAVLQTAQRALDRRELARAEELARRATLTFEVIRLTRPGLTAVAAEPLAPGQAPSAEPLTAAWNDLVRLRASAAQVGCETDIAVAESLLRRAEARRDAADAAGARGFIRTAQTHLSRCEAMAKEAIETRIKPLRAAAERNLSATQGAQERARISGLIATADAAVARGQITDAQAALLQATGDVTAAAPPNPGTTDPKTGGKTPRSGKTPSAGAATAPSGSPAVGASPAAPPAVPGVTGPTVVTPGTPVVVVGPPAPGQQTATTPATAPERPAAPVSRITSDVLQPLTQPE